MKASIPIAGYSGVISILAVALFSGAALYISLVEHPVRFMLDPAIALQQWQPSYNRAAVIQASLAGIGALMALISGWINRQKLWFTGALLIGSVIPLTLIFVMPVNHALFALTPTAPVKDILNLLTIWGNWHAARTVLSLGAFAVLMSAWRRSVR